MAHPSFMALPRELRDMIYLHYVADPGGYIYDFESGKLRASNNNPIDLSLIYTCRQIADEMKGFALGANTLTFSTVDSETCDTSARASLFDAALGRLDEMKRTVVNHSRDLITEKIGPQVAHHFPTSSALLRHLVEVERREPSILNDFSRLWQPAPSLLREFINYILQLISKDYRFWEARRLALEREPATAVLLLLDYKPWMIPTDNDLSTLKRIVFPHDTEDDAERSFAQDHSEQAKYHFSAAAAAIKFLNSVSSDVRTRIRKMVLKEDRKSVAFPESHGKGLIGFCQENPHLRIERRVDMWRTVFPYGIYLGITTDRAYEQLDCQRATKRMAVWIDEAVALGRAGMPTDAFSLIFEAPPNNSQMVMDILKRDALWQDAVSECDSRGFLRKSRLRPMYISQSFPQTMKDMIRGRLGSLVRIDADYGDVWHVEHLIEENRACSLNEWHERYRMLTPKTLVPDPPLPSWLEIQCEYLRRP